MSEGIATSLLRMERGGERAAAIDAAERWQDMLIAMAEVANAEQVERINYLLNPIRMYLSNIGPGGCGEG